MQNIDVIYLYESAARELDVACAVKCIAEQCYGIQTQIVQWPNGVPRALSDFRPRVVVLPHCYHVGLYSDLLLEWRKSVYFNLTWEQFLYEGNREVKSPRGEFAWNHVIHHVWSDSFAIYLQNQGIPRENIITNGNPGYILYEEPYRHYFRQRRDLAKEYQLDLDSRWIFFPENYAWAFYSDDLVEGFVQSGTSREDASAMRHFSRESLEEVIKWCAMIATYGDVELIIRPRPTTPLNKFKAAIQQVLGVIPNQMHITKDGSIREWIMASDVVVSSYSTSLIEAALAAKNAYMLEPYPIPECFFMEWHDYVTRIKTQGAFKNACLNGRTGLENEQLANWARSTMLARGDVIWNLADFLARICRGESQCPPIPSRRRVTPPGKLRVPALLSCLLFEYRRIRWKKKRRTSPDATEIDPGWEGDIVSPIIIDERVKKWKRVLAGYSPPEFPDSWTSALR